MSDPAYGAALSEYFAVSKEAEGASPTGAAKIAAALAGSPELVAHTVVKALESTKPKARYPVTAMAKWMPRLMRILPTKTWDKIQTAQFSS